MKPLTFIIKKFLNLLKDNNYPKPQNSPFLGICREKESRKRRITSSLYDSNILGYTRAT